MAEIKEVMEVLEAFKVGAETYGKVMEDGKVSWTDIPTVMDMFPAIQAAVVGAGEIPAELKDLDPAEAAAIYGKLVEVYNAWKAAFA